VFGLRVVLVLHLARLTTTVSMILIRIGLAALGAFFATLSALLAATVFRFVLARSFRATVRAFGATRFGLLLLIGLRRALRHRHREDGQQEGEQHNEYSALSGFHFCSPRQMMITIRDTSAHTGTPL
jgi:hypothetical protein